MASGLVVLWLVAIAALYLRRPETSSVTEALRLLPDLLRLLKRLVADRSLEIGIRVRVVLLLAYLASPIDLIPDFVPVLGYADDAIVVALVLRSVGRRAGPDALAEHWPGTPEGLTTLLRVCGFGDAQENAGRRMQTRDR